MRIALCNEVIAGRDFAAQCAFAAALGYDGLEVAPFTLADDPLAIGAADRVRFRRAAADAGIAITGLHWLLVKPAGLSITTADGALRARTVAAMTALVDLCADLGGSYLVHGSPAQRRVPEGESRDVAWSRARDAPRPPPTPRPAPASSTSSSRCRATRPTSSTRSTRRWRWCGRSGSRR